MVKVLPRPTDLKTVVKVSSRALPFVGSVSWGQKPLPLRKLRSRSERGENHGKGSSSPYRSENRGESFGARPTICGLRELGAKAFTAEEAEVSQRTRRKPW